MRSILNKKMPPDANRMAPTAPLRHGLRSGRRGRRWLRRASCEPLKRRVSTDVIGWSSHTKSDNERNTHETRYRLTCHYAHLPWLRKEIRREDRTAEKQSDNPLRWMRCQHLYQCGRSEQGNQVHPKISGRPQQNAQKFRKVTAAHHSAAPNPLELIFEADSCGLLCFVSYYIRRRAKYVWTQLVAGNNTKSDLLDSSAVFSRNAAFRLFPFVDCLHRNSA